MIAPFAAAVILVAYPNLLAYLSARRCWDQWHAFMIGNSILGALYLAYALHAGILPAVWGRVSGPGLLLALAVGLIPLVVILTAIFLPGQLGRDIVASGIGTISTNHFVYRVLVQVALTTVVCEELLFRGVLQALLVRAAGARTGVLLDAAVFGLWHATLQYNGFTSARGLARWGAALGGTGVYGLLGFVLAIVRQSAGGLLAAIVAHGVLDVCMFIGMYARRRQLAT